MTDDQLAQILEAIEKLTLAVEAQTRQLPQRSAEHFIDAQGRHCMRIFGEAGGTVGTAGGPGEPFLGGGAGLR